MQKGESFKTFFSSPTHNNHSRMAVYANDNDGKQTRQ